MIIVVDEAPQTGEPITEIQEEVTEEVQAEETQQPEYEIPEKYAGKSMQEGVEMHQQSEKLMSKQSNEVGEQRKLIQSLIDAQNKATDTAPPEETVTQEDNFFTDPVKAVNQAIENHPDVIKAREERVGNVQTHNLAALDKAYPNWQETVQESTFLKFIGDSEARTEMFRLADTEYRSDLAIELFDWYSTTEMSKKTQEAKAGEKTRIQTDMKKTSSETRSSGDSVGGKKIYRRADLIRLRTNNPERYESLQDEILQAYSDGRVK